MANWLYISGRGHSGSTMLDAMLGNADSIESVGELVSGMGRYEALCSCGETFQDCPFWAGVRQRFEENAGVSWNEAVRASRGHAHIKRFPSTLFSPAHAKWVRRLKGFSEYMAGAISRSGAAKKEMVVDSSKEITRGLFLLRFVPGSRVIHLVRHPEKVLQSDYYRLKNGSGFKFLRIRFMPRSWYGPFLFISAVSWLVGNLLCEVVRLFGRDRFLRVRYEDLIASPVEQLERIEKFAGVSLEEVKRRVPEKQPFDVGHNIGGNHMRMAKSFVLDPKKASRKGLPKRYSLMVHALCWPLLWKYGYYSTK
jgi:hypothetical protein